MSAPGAALTVTLYEWDELVGLVVTPDRMAVLVVDEDADDPVRYSLAHRPNMSADMFQMCGEWAVAELTAFLAGRPGRGWHRRRTDGVWQLWASLEGLPPID
ncbi:hypothetical protein ACIBBG_26835 [Micromonospora chersina]|uniref:hypothetical protein n=1 Tax=Micromonospora chersina TaxID=47854 RepID=UPI0037951E24